MTAQQKEFDWLFPHLAFSPLRGIDPALNLTFELTRNPEALASYFAIRAECYRKDLGITGIALGPDRFDALADIFIVRKAGQIIGGARTLISKPDTRILLPLEAEGFQLQQALPNLQLMEHSYCEITRLAILPEHRTMHITEYLIRFMLVSLECQGADYLFTNSPLVQARSYRRIFRKLGYHYEIMQDIDMPAQKAYAKLPNVVLSAMPFNQAVHIVKASANSTCKVIYQPKIAA